MGSPSHPENDVWDLDRLRLPAELVGDPSGRRRPPRHRPGDPFIKGPIPYAWIASACRLPGAGLHVAMSYRFYLSRFRFKRRGRRWGLSDVANGLRISDDSARRGLRCGRAGRVAGRGTGAGLQAGRLRLGSPGAGGRAETSAVVRADPLGLVAPGLPAPGEISPSRVRLLALGRLEPIGRFRAGVGRLGRVRPLPLFGLPGPGCVGAGRVGLRRPDARPVTDSFDFRSRARSIRLTLTHTKGVELLSHSAPRPQSYGNGSGTKDKDRGTIHERAEAYLVRWHSSHHFYRKHITK